MELPKALIQEVKKGKVVLLLGSGALYGASLPGKDIPLGNDLRDILCKEYLDESFKNDSLAHVAAIATSQSGLANVQDFIKDYFSGLTPAPFHLKIPAFKWRAMFTTNYDRLVEIVYENAETKLQEIYPLISNSDNFDETRVTNDKLPLVKLHGCITRTHDSELPLVLTVDQYNDSLTNRDRLFRYLYELAYDNTIVFVGHSLQDPNIRAVMLEVQRNAPQGQRHYLIKPGLRDAENTYWAEKRITGLQITFEAFIEELDKNITSVERSLSLVSLDSTHPIQGKFVTKASPSEELISFLTNDVEYVHTNMPIQNGDPKDFYKGGDLGWYPLDEKLSITRSIESEIFENVIEKAEVERSGAELFVIKGEAGSGKSVLLRNLAWSAKDSKVGVFLWVKQGSNADIDLIEEIINKTNERVFVIWDDAAVNAINIERFFSKAKSRGCKVTILTAERFNEWNIRCEELDEIVTDLYKVKYLSENEIESLLRKLDEHDSLGPNLARKSFDERKSELKEIHGRQLLVALHEATMGEPFEDIVFNEYSNIVPESARAIYLTVCTLNRLRIPVRAGLISRIHEISFTDFKRDFYRPLEKVVLVRGGGDQDAHYIARHSEIAEIVFSRALENSEDRYREYMNIVSRLNLSFSSDKQSFRSLIRAKALHELFTDFQDVSALYKHAKEYFGDEPYLLQQMANYERIRPNGSLETALDLLNRAKDKAPYDSSIIHSLAVVWRDKAKNSEELHLRKKCRAEATAYLDMAARRWGDSSYITSSVLELMVDSLSDTINDELASQRVIDDSIRKVQQVLSESKQKYPSEAQIHLIESQFSSLIKDHARAIKALENSFSERDRDPYLAIRLSTYYKEKNEIEKAKNILQLALERRRGDHRLNFHYAELLRETQLQDPEELFYYYRRAFTPGDKNYQAQFWFARYAFISNDKSQYQIALDTFENIRNAKLSHSRRVEILDYDIANGQKKNYFGVVHKKRSGFGFIRMDGSGVEVFFPAKSVEDDLWDALREGDRVLFNLGFSFSGPVACGVRCS
ncbi:SIR2 family protein [Aliikangiella maris]|uniref:SIR2 family protein n=2 Tax=Aliikangiella maris TaxID=3162458 RepID=A0ABV2BWC1_9GAMM